MLGSPVLLTSRPSPFEYNCPKQEIQRIYVKESDYPKWKDQNQGFPTIQPSRSPYMDAQSHRASSQMATTRFPVPQAIPEPCNSPLTGSIYFSSS